MPIPKVMGFPLYTGVKRRVAKSYYHLFFRNWKWYKQFENAKPGDLLNDCSGFNIRVAKLRPEYCPIGKNGKVLVDITIENDKGGCCSLTNCGIEWGLPKEEVISRREAFLEEIRKSGKDEWGFLERSKSISVDEEGKLVKNG